jgi:hypothetical protein
VGSFALLQRIGADLLRNTVFLEASGKAKEIDLGRFVPDLKAAGKTKGQTWSEFWSQCSKDCSCTGGTYHAKKRYWHEADSVWCRRHVRL